MKRKILISLILLSFPHFLEASGGVRGKVMYTGERLPSRKLSVGVDSEVCGSSISSEELILGKRGEVKNVVVFLAGQGLPLYKTNSAQEPPVDLTQEKCRFTPRVVFIAPGQELKVLNRDGILHNFHTLSQANQSTNRAQLASTPEMTLRFPRSEIFAAVCDVHSWMKSWIVVKAHPFYTITNDKGEFELNDIPAGTYALQFWHEKLGEKSQVLQIKEGETNEVSLKMGVY